MSSNAEVMDLTSSTDKQTKGTFGSNVTSTSSTTLGNPERKDVGTQTQLSCGCHKVNATLRCYRLQSLIKII